MPYVRKFTYNSPLCMIGALLISNKQSTCRITSQRSPGEDDKYSHQNITHGHMIICDPYRSCILQHIHAFDRLDKGKDARSLHWGQVLSSSSPSSSENTNISLASARIRNLVSLFNTAVHCEWANLELTFAWSSEMNLNNDISLGYRAHIVNPSCAHELHCSGVLFLFVIRHD